MYRYLSPFINIIRNVAFFILNNHPVCAHLICFLRMHVDLDLYQW